jgi:hypothetical protein
MMVQLIHCIPETQKSPSPKALFFRISTALQEMFPPLFPFKLTPNEIDHLRQLLFPIIRILFVCFNITLVNFIKRCLAEKKVPLWG